MVDLRMEVGGRGRGLCLSCSLLCSQYLEEHLAHDGCSVHVNRRKEWMRDGG